MLVLAIRPNRAPERRAARDGTRRRRPRRARRAGSQEHEARAAILAELHARPFLPIELPQRIYHFAFATNEEEARADRAALAELLRSHMLPTPTGDAKFQRLSIGDWRLRWEQHTEFTTYTWSTQKDAGEPFAPSRSARRRRDRLSAAGPADRRHPSLRRRGRPFARGFRAAVQLAEPLPRARGQGRRACADRFRRRSLRLHPAAGEDERHRRAGDGAAAAARAGDRDLSHHGPARPAGGARAPARSCGRWRARSPTSPMRSSQTQDMRTSRDLLKRSSDLLAKSEALSTRTAFRFGASRAYHAIVKNRLALIQEAKESHYTTISAFFSARLDPAIETCNAFEARQARLAAQVERAVDLMRTGITFELEQQNRDLLDDMNRRARLQMRLQKLVGGLSIAALSYYVAGLSLYFFKGVKDAGFLPFGFTGEEAAAAAMPLVIFGAWAFWQRVKRLSAKAQEEERVS